MGCGSDQTILTVTGTVKDVQHPHAETPFAVVLLDDNRICEFKFSDNTPNHMYPGLKATFEIYKELHDNHGVAVPAEACDGSIKTVAPLPEKTIGCMGVKHVRCG